MEKDIDKKVQEFLRESNAIEREYSEQALQDANMAWVVGVLNFKTDFSIDLILGIHRRLLKRLAPHYAGSIRTVPVYIGGERRSQNKEEIIEQLEDLIKRWKIFRKRNKKEEAEEFIKRWHIQFEKVHPFCDGNGRTGRILMNLQRLNMGLPLLIIHEGEEQMRYYRWFRERGF